MTWTVFTVGNPEAQRFTDREPARQSLEERAHKALVAAGYDSLWLHAIEQRRDYDHARKRSRLVGIRAVPLLPGYALVRHDDPASQPAIELAVRRLRMPTIRRGTVPVVSGTLGIVAGGAAALEHLRAAAPTGQRSLSQGDLVHIIAGRAVQAEPVRIEVLTRAGARVTIGTVAVVIPVHHLEAA